MNIDKSDILGLQNILSDVDNNDIISTIVTISFLWLKDVVFLKSFLIKLLSSVASSALSLKHSSTCYIIFCLLLDELIQLESSIGKKYL